VCKRLEEDNKAGKLDKAKEIVGVVARIGPRAGKKVDISLGSTTTLSIDDAREFRTEYNRVLANHDDPLQYRIAKQQVKTKAAAKHKTFGQVAKEYHAERTDPENDKSWTERTGKQMAGIMRVLAKTPFNNLLVANIESIDIAEVVNARKETPVMALRYCEFIRGAMDLARDQYCYAHANPADPKGPLKRFLRIKHSSVQHPGWHHRDAPRLAHLLRVAEIDTKNNGLYTTAQAAKAIGRERAQVLKLIKTGKLPAKQSHIGKTCTYLIDPGDLAKCGFPIVDFQPQWTRSEAALALALLRFIQLTGVRFSEANRMEWCREQAAVH
jgi:hypothetical protein